MSSLKQSGGAAPKSAAIRSFEAQWRAREADPISALREKAMQRFLRLGLPSTRDESWRYTNLRHLASQSFIDAPRAPAGALERIRRRLKTFLDRPSNRVATVLMVNGYPVLPSAAWLLYQWVRNQ